MSWETIKERIVWKKPQKTIAELPTIEKKKYEPYDCEDCGKTLCEMRVVLTSIRQFPFLHMKHHCKACNKMKNPETGKYTETRHTFDACLRNKKRT